MPDYSLTESYEFFGHWWLPDSPDERRPGLLKTGPDGFELALLEQFSPSSINAIPAAINFPRFDCVFGETDAESAVTLWAVAAHSLGNRTLCTVHAVVIGQHIRDAGAKFDAMTIQTRMLTPFVRRIALNGDHGVEDGKLVSLTLKYTLPESLTWRVESIATELSFSNTTKMNRGWFNAGFDVFEQAIIRPSEALALSDFMVRANKLTQLLTLLSGFRDRFLRLSVETTDGHPLAVLVRDPSPKDDDEVRLLLCLSDISAFDSVLERWFAMSDIMRDAVNLTVDATRTDRHTLEGRFLFAAHSVEVISRALHPGVYMPPEAYQRVIDALTAAIPPEVGDDHRKSLATKIQYGNEVSLRNRIRNLLRNLSPEAVELICKSPSAFACGVADTRNYLTHFTDELRQKVLPRNAIYLATEKLLQLARIHLLKYVGVEEGLIVIQLKKHWKYGQLPRMFRHEIEVVA